MKRFKYFWAPVCLTVFLFVGCGGENAKSYGEDDTSNHRVIVRIKISSDGTLDYTGSGDFEGVEIFASNPALAGDAVYLEKNESEYFVAGYISLSSKYSIRFTKEESNTAPSVFYDVHVTLPFSRSMLTTEGGTSKNVRVCGLTNGAVIPFDTVLTETGLIQADATMPFSFFSGYLKTVVLPETSGTIKLAGRSYKSAEEAGHYLTDPNGVEHPDTVRGTDHVQPGEPVMLTINQTAFGDNVTASDWSLAAPEGSASVLRNADGYRTFIPDTAGVYHVTLALEGINGKRSEETIAIVAQNYSFLESEGSATCLRSCHDGSMASSGKNDNYGRPILRDIVTPWRASAHADAFASIAAVTSSTCLQCHATGFLFADRNGDGTDEYMAASGFDDTIADWSAPAATGSAHLRGVTCEACHGPGTGAGTFEQSHYSSLPISSVMCLSCHEQESSIIHFFGYSDSHDHAHTLAGGNVAQNAECAKCHTGEGMLKRIFGADITTANPAGVTGIGCPVCHDPHGEGGNESQLRVSGTYDLEFASGNLAVNAGKGLICYNCHNADAILPSVGTIPHNAQAELLNGVGGYDYDENLSPIHGPHSLLSCSDCHMRHVNGTTHDMNMAVSAPARIASCQTSPCHAATSPEYNNGHYDMNGNLVAVRADIQQLADTINKKAGLRPGATIRAVYSTESEELTTALNRAAYNYNFILSDRSSGFHNPVYADRLIQLSLEDLGRY